MGDPNFGCDCGHRTKLEKILHTEDDEDIREITRMSLNMIGGLELLQCPTGEIAIEAAPAFEPDLFLMDVMMPGIGGLEAVRRLRDIKRFRDTPVVFVTARATKDEVNYLKSEFAAEVITKPFDPLVLPVQIEELWYRGFST